MDGSRFDGLLRDAARRGSRRALVAGVVAALVGGTLLAPWAHEAAASKKCGKGRNQCHGKCCPRNAPVCCRTGCCRKGFQCCQNGTRCCKK
jgi:hypothetical protein